MRGALQLLPDPQQLQLEQVPEAARTAVAGVLSQLPQGAAVVVVVVQGPPAAPAAPDPNVTALVALVRELVDKRGRRAEVAGVEVPTQADVEALDAIEQRKAKVRGADVEARRPCEELPGVAKLARRLERDYARQRRRKK